MTTKFKQKFNEINNDGNKSLSDKIQLLILEEIHDNSVKLTWLIATVSLVAVILISLLIRGG